MRRQGDADPRRGRSHPQADDSRRASADPVAHHEVLRPLGYKDFVLCLGHLGDQIRDFFLNYRSRVSDFTIDFADNGAVRLHNAQDELDWRVTLAETGGDTLTGSRVKRIERYIGNDAHFMLTYGDGVGDIDLAALAQFHAERDAVMTVSGVRPPGRFGEIVDADGRVTEFNEKPQATGGRISGGFFVCRRKLFDHLDPGRDDQVLESGPMRALARDGLLSMYRHDGFWQCMDTHRDYLLLNDLAAGEKAPWMLW